MSSDHPNVEMANVSISAVPDCDDSQAQAAFGIQTQEAATEPPSGGALIVIATDVLALLAARY
jgi:hypothetical protein